MDAAALRGICLGFPGAFEDFPFGPETSVFKVRAAVSGGARHHAKMFALSALAAADLSVSLKCEPPRPNSSARRTRRSLEHGI